MFFSTLKGLSWNLGTLCVSFYRIRKIGSFFLKARSNSKITLIKNKCIVIYGKNNGGNIGYCVLEKFRVTYSGLKMLEIIITEATFFLYGSSSIWVFFFFFFTATVGEGGYLCNSSWETNILRQTIYGEVILNRWTKDQKMLTKVGEEFHKW